MDTPFSPHNLHLTSPKLFAEHDPHLARLNKMALVFHSPLLQEFPADISGIYTLGGGRQIGKSTLLKQWMLHLLTIQKVNPNNIVFFTGEIIDDHHHLLSLIESQLKLMKGPLGYIIIDEITYIKNWDKAIKYAADAGWFEQTIVFLTGSDLLLMREARMRFPGRRGQARQVDFHLYPLSFKEVLELKGKSSTNSSVLYDEFMLYLQHGGYLTAINDFDKHHKILDSTFQTYSDWIRGDMQKRGKQDLYLKEILGAILKKYTSQLTWNALAKELSIDHHKTVSDYIDLLCAMDAVFVQSALLEDKLLPAPKKAKKVIFTDPFIFHAVNGWVHPTQDLYQEQVLPLMQDQEALSKLVESTVVTHFQRQFPTYYIKAEGEVDLAYIDKGKFWPIEIKWTNQPRPKDLKQISKYPNGRVWVKTQNPSPLNGVKADFLPLALAKMV